MMSIAIQTTCFYYRSSQTHGTDLQSPLCSTACKGATTAYASLVYSEGREELNSPLTTSVAAQCSFTTGIDKVFSCSLLFCGKMAPLTASAMALGSARAPLPTSPHASFLLICTHSQISHIFFPCLLISLACGFYTNGRPQLWTPVVNSRKPKAPTAVPSIMQHALCAMHTGDLSDMQTAEEQRRTHRWDDADSQLLQHLQLGACEGAVPHECVHCWRYQQRPRKVPRSELHCTTHLHEPRHIMQGMCQLKGFEIALPVCLHFSGTPHTGFLHSEYISRRS